MSEMSTVAAGVLEMTREFKAPLETVWRAFTDPQAVARWGVGHRYDNLCLDMDVREGGAYYHRVRGRQNGAVFTFFGVYFEVQAHRRLVYSFDWKTDWRQPPTPSRVELEFAAGPGGTSVSLVHSGHTEEGMESTRSHWTEFTDLLEQMLASGEIR